MPTRAPPDLTKSDHQDQAPVRPTRVALSSNEAEIAGFSSTSKNPIDRATYLGDPITSPGPDGRAHQVNDGDSSKPKSTLQTKIEVRRVNTQKEIRRVRAEITE